MDHRSSAALAVVLVLQVVMMGIYANSEVQLVKITLTENAEPVHRELLNLREKLGDSGSGSSSDPQQRQPPFSVISGNKRLRNLIQINAETGALLLVGSVDREELCLPAAEGPGDECQHLLIVSCGSQVLEVQVTVVDVNDEAPTFVKREMQLEVLESAQMGQLIDLPRAVDLDSARFGIQNYAIVEQQQPAQSGSSVSARVLDYFKLTMSTDNKQNSGHRGLKAFLRVTRLLDRERVERFSFTLAAYDTKNKEGRVALVLVVKDVNDNNPQWIGLPYRVRLRECSSRREIFRLQATDPDEPGTQNSKLEYHIDHAKSAEPKLLRRRFYVSGHTVVLIDGSLRGLAQTVSFVPLKVVDGGGLENSTELRVEVEDCNDFAPQISLSARSGTVRENRNGSSEILTSVNVKDEDLGANCEFECHLNDTGSDGHLNLKLVLSSPLSGKSSRSPRGLMRYYQIETRPHRPLDRETVSHYSVLIICSDHGEPALTSSQRYSVVVADENDNSPRFERKRYQFQVMENSVAGRGSGLTSRSDVVGVTRASDADAGENARLSYKLDSTGEQFFSVNERGEILARRRFDREERDRYNFSVLAQDGGGRVASAHVQVQVLDANDCAPVFERNFQFSVPESYGSSTVHSELGVVRAVDADSGKNSEIEYSILEPQLQQTGQYSRGRRRPRPYSVQISARTGKLTVYGVLDREVESTMFVEVVARDRGKPSPLSAVTTVTVTVLDLNDNKPHFSFPASGGHVNVSRHELDSAESGPVLIARLEATDRDAGPNGTVHYELVSASTANNDSGPVIVEADGRVFLRQRSNTARQHKRPLLFSERVLVRAVDGGLGSPHSEVGSLVLRYLWPSPPFLQPREPHPPLQTPLDRDRRPISRGGARRTGNTGGGSGGDTSRGQASTSSYILILYCLAAVVFIVFLSVLCVLIYFYTAGRGMSGTMHRKASSNTAACKMQTINNQSDFLDNSQFETNIMAGNIYGFQNTLSKMNDGHRLQQHALDNSSSYMQLMTNVPASSSGCNNEYNPLTMYTTSFPSSNMTYGGPAVAGAGGGSFLDMSHHSSPILHGHTAVASGAGVAPASSSTSKRTLSSILKRRSPQTQDRRAHSVSSTSSAPTATEATALARAQPTTLDVCVSINNHLGGINEKYVSSSFV